MHFQWGTSLGTGRAMVGAAVSCTYPGKPWLNWQCEQGLHLTEIMALQSFHPSLGEMLEVGNFTICLCNHLQSLTSQCPLHHLFLLQKRVE